MQIPAFGPGVEPTHGNTPVNQENSSLQFTLIMKKLFLKNLILFGIITINLVKPPLLASMANKFKLMENSVILN